MEGVQATPADLAPLRMEEVVMQEEGQSASPTVPQDASETLYISNLNESIKLPGMPTPAASKPRGQY